MRYIYVHPDTGPRKPLNSGINYAKRVARDADKRDQLAVQAELGFGLPQQRNKHQHLVQSRHSAYHDRYDATRKEPA